MKRKKLSIKKQTINDQTLPQKTSNLYKVDYKIQDTDGFQKIKMIVPLQGRTALAQRHECSLGTSISHNDTGHRGGSIPFVTNQTGKWMRAYLVDAPEHIGHTWQDYLWGTILITMYFTWTRDTEGDPRDQQGQSTFQCILITTQWSRLNNLNHGPVPQRVLRQLFGFLEPL